MESIKVNKNVSLKPYNTFGIDVKAEFFLEVKSEVHLKKILLSQEFNLLPKLIIGGGSNILLTKDFGGLVLKISIPDINVVYEDDESVLIRAGAGVIWHDFVIFCVQRNFGGIENLSLIPGTVGAAPIQNIGAYGQELRDVFENLEGVYLNSSKSAKFNREECGLNYRDSIFKNKLKDKFIVTYVTLRLRKKPEINIGYGNVRKELEKTKYNTIGIKEVSDVITKIRLNKLPDPAKIGNAGSFFKNPEVSIEKFMQLKKEFADIVGYKLNNGKVKIPAGWMIEKCGWKGKKVGNTGAHAKQALVLVNYGDASGQEILNLAEEIKKSIIDNFGIKLQEEVNII